MTDEILHGPYTTLALAVIHHAMQDLKSDNPARVAEARAWLQFVGIDWCELLGITGEELNTWVASGFALPDTGHRNWRY